MKLQQNKHLNTKKYNIHPKVMQIKYIKLKYFNKLKSKNIFFIIQYINSNKLMIKFQETNRE